MPTLRPVPEIAIGEGRIDGLADDVVALAPKARAVLVIADPGLASAGVLQPVLYGLSGRSWRTVLFDGLAGEPTAEQIDGAAAMARTEAADLVVGIGGGSALDVAKMVGAVVPGSGGAEQYQFCAKPFLGVSLPVICVPTTAGTGSETTITAVFTNSCGKKAWAWGPELRAAKAILDPALTRTLPPHLVAATGIDALVHAIEAATNSNRFAANDAACHAAIRLICQHLPAAVREPENTEAREGMLVAACLAGIGINNAGTAMAHVIAHALGTLGKVHHGRAAGLGLAASLPWSIAAGEPAFAAVAEAMGGPKDAAALPGLVDALIAEVGLKAGITDELPGLTAERLAAEMAAPENAAMRASASRPSNEADLLHMARVVLTAK